MAVVIRILVLACVAAGLLACAETRLPAPAAAMPVFAAGQAHPAVARILGLVKADVCLGRDSEAAAADHALAALRRSAEAKGAGALADYRYAVVTNPPRMQQCRRYLQAQAMAVVLEGGGAD